MFSFRQCLRRDTATQKIENYRMRLNLATIAFDRAATHLDSGNIYLYTALTHLVGIQELGVNMSLYDYLQFNTHATLDLKVVTYVKSLLDHLEHIINEMEVKAYNESHQVSGRF